MPLKVAAVVVVVDLDGGNVDVVMTSSLLVVVCVMVRGNEAEASVTAGGNMFVSMTARIPLT